MYLRPAQLPLQLQAWLKPKICRRLNAFAACLRWSLPFKANLAPDNERFIAHCKSCCDRTADLQSSTEQRGELDFYGRARDAADALPVAPLYLACFPQHSTATLAVSPAMSFVRLAPFIVHHPSTSLSIAELFFWTIMGSLRSQKTK